MQIDNETVGHVFTYHAPKEGQVYRYQVLRDAGRAFAQIILSNCPDSQERTLALRDVQRAAMFANASIAVNESEHG